MQLQYQGRWSPSQQQCPESLPQTQDYLPPLNSPAYQQNSNFPGQAQLRTVTNNSASSQVVASNSAIENKKSSVTENQYHRLGKVINYGVKNNPSANDSQRYVHHRIKFLNNNSYQQQPNQPKQQNSQHQMNYRPHNIVLGNQRQNNTSLRNLNSKNVNKSSEQNLGKISRNSSLKGIKIVSRNSSCDKNSNNTSLQKKSVKTLDRDEQNEGKNKHNNKNSAKVSPFQQQQREGEGLCGFKCTNNYRFANTDNQISIPKLNSLDTFKTQTDDQNGFQRRNNTENAFYQNKNKQTKIYETIREQMQQQISNAKKAYQKKFQNQIETISIFYSGQIDTLQKVLGENQTLIDNQAIKIKDLEGKFAKKQARMQKYQERFKSIQKFISSADTFTIQRITQLQNKFSYLVSQYNQMSHFTAGSNRLQNRLDYLQSIFSDVLAQTITKYRSIEHDLKEQIKQMLQKYEYFEQKVYQMDLLKNVGKQNQIQNYRMKQKIDNLRENIKFIETRATATGNGFSSFEKMEMLSPHTSNSKMHNQQQQLQQQEENSNNNLKAILNEISKKIQQLQQQENIQIKDLKIQKQSFKMKIQQLTNKNDENNIQLQHLQSKSQSQQQQIRKLNAQILNTNNLNDQLVQKVKHLQERISSSQTQQPSSKQIQIKQLKKMIQSTKQVINNLRLQLEQQVKQKQELQQALEIAEKMFDEQIIKFKQNIKQLQEQNSDLLNQVDILHEQKDKLYLLHKSSISSASSNKSQQFVEKVKLTQCKSPKRQHAYANMSHPNRPPYEQIKFQKVREILKRTPYSQQYDTFSYDTEAVVNHKAIANTNTKSNINTQSPFIQKQYFKSSSQSFDNHYSQSKETNQKVAKLKQTLLDDRCTLPVQCSIGQSGELVYSLNNMYIVDKNYETFDLTKEEIKEAIKNKIIKLK